MITYIDHFARCKRPEDADYLSAAHGEHFKQALGCPAKSRGSIPGARRAGSGCPVPRSAWKMGRAARKGVPERVEMLLVEA